MRRPVLQFAQLMEAKLQQHDHTRGPAGWQQELPDYLLDRLDQEVAELRKVVLARDSAVDVALEAVDVGNLAMMVMDCYARPTKRYWGMEEDAEEQMRADLGIAAEEE